MTEPDSREATPLADVERIAYAGWALWRAAMSGVDGHVLAKVFARMHAPRIGDLVVERTQMRRGAVDPDGVGYLRDTWAPLLDPADRSFTVEPLHRPGEFVRWGNAEFFAVPDRADLWKWARA